MMVFLSFPVLVLFYSESNLLWSPAGRQCRSGGVDRLVQENLDQVIGAVIFFIARFVAVAVVFFRIFRYDNRVLAPDIPDAFIQAAVQGDAGVDLHPPGLHTFDATATVAVSGTFLAWVFQFAGQITILSPEPVREMYAEMLRTAMAGMENTAICGFKESGNLEWKL